MVDLTFNDERSPLVTRVSRFDTLILERNVITGMKNTTGNGNVEREKWINKQGIPERREAFHQDARTVDCG